MANTTTNQGNSTSGGGYMSSYIPGTNVSFHPVTPPYNFGAFPGLPDASHVTISPDILNSMQQYSDAAYNSATRTLDPQWAAKQAQFNQQMVGQGLQPGSDAYNNAYANFTRSQNDAYSQARDQAMQQGLQAQGQGFQEGYANSNLQNELAKAGLAANASMYDAAMNAGGQTTAAQIAAEASMKNNALNNQTSQLADLGQLGLGYGQLQLGQGRLGLDTQNSQFANMMGLSNFLNGQNMYNNTLPGQEIGNMSPFFSMIPNAQPSPIDVTGAYGLNAGMQNNAYGAQVQQQNAQNQMYGEIASAAAIAAMMF